MEQIENIKNLLNRIYGEQKGGLAFERIMPIIEEFPKPGNGKHGYFSQEDIVLITYGDSLHRDGETPLFTFNAFAEQYLDGVFSFTHFLPFFPYSSDDGFSVMDYFKINPELGTWDDVAVTGKKHKLMFDHVLNHISSKSEWFHSYLNDEQGYENLAIEADPSADLSMVTRPRALPLLTRYSKKSGQVVHVWTTFSADQIDLNYKSIDVLEKMVQVLLFYVSQGAEMIRFDAIAYLWKEMGTSCVHLQQTHDMVRLFRCILDVVSPMVIILTETNVPHHENISYFGDGTNEAQMVYNFTLPPLLFHTFIKQDAGMLSEWAKGLSLDSKTNTFLNFTASHDGIGVRPLEGILPPEEIQDIIRMVEKNNGRVSYKKNSDGSESPYELNITYVDALFDSQNKPDIHHANRFLASQAIQYVLPGVPATYIHSLLGSRNWQEGVRVTGQARTINREKLEFNQLVSELNDPESFRSRIFYPYTKMIKTRRKQPGFHPNSPFEILEFDPGIFGMKRYCEEQTIYCLTNISSRDISFNLSGDDVPEKMIDILSMKQYQSKNIQLKPYGYVWLEKAPKS